ncbi:MAG: methylated-DNA--[protein]-cysteine S-methyltransferase [Verrucomicrobiae bacterium]|nr:methylated-DNA--[protein]-cysteine S-methyltransferase [Verrucomicrobiae bacterium]
MPIPSRWGEFLASYGEAGLRSIDFPGAVSAGPLPSDALVPAGVVSWHEATSDAVGCVLEGSPVTRKPPLDWSEATAFQRAVWEALAMIPVGRVCTYGEIARQIGHPAAARAVGAACGANPIPLLVPCHRVVAAGGRLGGFAGGREWKQRLLAVEGHKIHHFRRLLW